MILYEDIIQYENFYNIIRNSVISNYWNDGVTDNGAFFREADRLDSLIQLIYRLLISALRVISRHHTDVYIDNTLRDYSINRLNCSVYNIFRNIYCGITNSLDCLFGFWTCRQQNKKTIMVKKLIADLVILSP